MDSNISRSQIREELRKRWTAQAVELALMGRWDEAVQANLRSNLLAGCSGAMDAFFMTAMVCSIIWLLLYAIATWKGAGLEKGISYILFILFILSLLIFPAMGLELAWLNMLMMIVYVVLFAIFMFVLCAWLWKGKEAA